jgi:hypothetical protein
MSSVARGRRGEGGQGGEGGDSGDAGTNAEPEPNARGRGPREGVAGGEAEAALTAPAVGSKRGELLGAATPKPWLDWATLLRRTYDLDVLACPCGGRLRFIALVTEREAIVPLLESLGLPTPPPVRARARSPTLFDTDSMPVYA